MLLSGTPEWIVQTCHWVQSEPSETVQKENFVDFWPDIAGRICLRSLQGLSAQHAVFEGIVESSKRTTAKEPQWLLAQVNIPAKAQALPHEGALALVYPELAAGFVHRHAVCMPLLDAS